MYFNCNKANCNSVVKEIVIMTNRLSIFLTVLFVIVGKFDVVVSQVPATNDSSLANTKVIFILVQNYIIEPPLYTVCYANLIFTK